MGILYPDLCTDSSSFPDGQGLPEIAKIKIQGLVAETLGRKSRQDTKKHKMILAGKAQAGKMKARQASTSSSALHHTEQLFTNR
jgi:hypothetical protein